MSILPTETAALLIDAEAAVLDTFGPTNDETPAEAREWTQDDEDAANAAEWGEPDPHYEDDAAYYYEADMDYYPAW